MELGSNHSLGAFNLKLLENNPHNDTVYMHSHAHAYAYSCTPVNSLTVASFHTRIRMNTYTNTHAHKFITRMHTQARYCTLYTHTHMPAHTRIHTRLYTQIHAVYAMHIHKYQPSHISLILAYKKIYKRR